MPFYLTVKSYGLYNSIWAVILPSALSTFNVIICKNVISRYAESDLKRLQLLMERTFDSVV